MRSYFTPNPVFSQTSVVDGVVYFGATDFSVYALNAHTGAKVWSYKTDSTIYFSSPAVANGVIYIGSDDDRVYALNARCGALLWEYVTGGEVESSPSVANGMVYIGSDGYNLYAFSLPDSDQRSRQGFGRPSLNTLHSDLSMKVSNRLATAGHD